MENIEQRIDLIFFPNWSDFFAIFLLWNYLHFYMD